ncbi:MAG: hypothetical protein NC081_07200 [Roseburia sp.]|nr:hypothetical protein [Roseburia sp.]
MSKVQDNYAALASAVGMRYDSVNNVIYGQKDGFDLTIYASDSSMPYLLTIHTAAKNPTQTALSKEESKELAKSVKSLGVCSQDGNNITVNVMNQTNQEKLKNNLTEGLSSFLSFLRSKSYAPCCSICGKDAEVASYVSGGSYLHLCPDCEADMRGKLAVLNQEKKQKKENVVGGIVGALIGSLLGVLCIVLLSQLGYVAALSGVAMAVGVLKGYELLGGKLSKKGIVISIVIMLVMTYAGDRLDWAISLLGEGGGAEAGFNLFECYRMVPAMFKLEIIDITAYIANLVLLYVFVLLGAVPTIRSRVKEKKEENRFVRLGSL